MGIVCSLNKALCISSGKYIVRMDADDISLPKRISKQVEYMEKNKDISVLGSAIKVFGDNVKEEKVIQFSKSPQYAKCELLFASCLAHPSVIIRKDFMDKHGLKYKEDFVGKEDYALWWDIASVGKISALKDVLLLYRIHPNQVTQTKNLKSYEISKRLLIYRLNDIGVKLSEKQIEVMLNYCLNKYENMKLDSIEEYIEILARIEKVNNISNYFDKNSLKKVCLATIDNIIKQTDLNKTDIKYIYNIAHTKGLISLPVLMEKILKNEYRNIIK